MQKIADGLDGSGWWPEKVQVDQDGSLRGDFRDLLDRYGIEEILVARDAHWSHGIVERKILTVKEMMLKLVHDSEIRGATLSRVAVIQCAQTINRLSNFRGFSPAQCVLGFQPNLPEIMSDGRRIPIADNEDHFAMAQRMKLLQDCEHACFCESQPFSIVVRCCHRLDKNQVRSICAAS